MSARNARLPGGGRRGFTLLELMVVSGIAITALVGVLGTYIVCLDLAETTTNAQRATISAQTVLEEMRATAFTSIYSTYDNFTFTVDGMATNMSLGRVTVNNSNSSLLNVTVGVCWQQRGGRIIGECTNASGALAYNDTDGNGVLDSPVQFTTQMAQR